MIDPDYKYPSLVRFNAAYDRDLGFFGLIGTAEFLYSQNVNDVKYENLNLSQVGTRPDGRPVYLRNVNTQISDAILLTNTDQGDAWSLVFKVDRPFRNGFFMSGSYLYGESTSILDGTSSQAASNWGNVYVGGSPNDPPLVRSNFDPGHRITISGGYDIPVPGGFTVTASAFYSGQSGRPWSANYANDYNGDVRGTNDLLYIPASASEFTFAGGTFEDLMAYVNAEPCLADYIGKIHERNACRAPWINTFDMRVNVGLPFKRLKAEITWDLLNMINLFDQQRRPARVRELQRPARRPAHGDHELRSRTTCRTCSSTACARRRRNSSRGTICCRAGRCSWARGFGSRALRFRDQEFGLRETQRVAIPGARVPLRLHPPHPRYRLLQVVPVDFDTDEIYPQAGARHGGAAEPQERIHHQLQT